MFSAGRVLIKPEGEYSPLKTYEMLDYVSYNGSSYIAKKTTTGNLPTDTEYWQLSASGAQSQNVTSNFAEVEGSDIASSPHAIDDVFVNKDGKLLKATQTISIGDTIVIDTNCEPTTVEDLISYLSTQVSTLNSSNKKLNGITEIAVQTDLHTLGLGEFYKDKTSFYVTNGPEEVDEVASAIFRLTVESALNDLSTTRLLTLKTSGGRVYTQNYDGSSWGDWEQVAFGSEVALKQNITDNTLQTNSKTVPGAINELFTKSQAVSNPNLLDNPWFTVNQRESDGIITGSNYYIDRWKTDALTSDNPMSYDADTHSIIIPANASTSLALGYALQPLEPSLCEQLYGKTVTMSFIVNGQLYSDTFTVNAKDTVTDRQYYPFENDGLYLGLYLSSAKKELRIRKSTAKAITSEYVISAVKLELGSVSTLAMDTAPNYATELLKCQRYFVRYSATSSCAVGFASTTTGAWMLFNLPCAMRTKTPSLTYSGTVKIECANFTGTLGIDITNLQFNTMSQNTIKAYATVASGLTPGQSCLLHLRDLGYMDISADL